MTDIPLKRRTRNTEIHAEGRQREEPGEHRVHMKIAIYSSRRKAKDSLPHNRQEEPVLLTCWSWTSSLQNHEAVNLCCLSHTPSGVLCSGRPSEPIQDIISKLIKRMNVNTWCSALPPSTWEVFIPHCSFDNSKNNRCVLLFREEIWDVFIITTWCGKRKTYGNNLRTMVNSLPWSLTLIFAFSHL